MFELRDYQQKSHNAALHYISGNYKKSGLIVVPTGGGKSLLQAKLVKDWNQKALIISPSIEILKQNYNKFIEYGGKASIYSASLKSKEIGDVTYASLKSIEKLGSEFKDQGVKLLVIDECLSKNNYIKLESGRCRIDEVVESFKNGNDIKVHSYNSKTKSIELKPVIAAKIMGEKNVYKITFSNKKVIETTLNHTLLTNNGWKKVSEIDKFDLVMSSDITHKNNLYPIFNRDQEDLMIGTSLGDSSVDLRKYNVFRIRCIQGEKQKDYLYWKASILNQVKVEEVKENGYAKKPAYRFNSKCFKLKENISSVEARIKSLNEKSLAVLWMDDGSLSKLNNAGTLYSLCYSEKYNILLKEKIESLGIKGVSVRKTKSSSTKKDVWYLGFKKEAVYMLSKLCAKYIHSNLAYKIIPEFRYLVGEYSWDNKFLGLGYNITSIKCLGQQETYEIEVQDNNSYIILGTSHQVKSDYGIISHNCHLNTDANGGMLKRFISKMNPKFKIGYTATPFRLESQTGPTGYPEAVLTMLPSTFPKIFDDYIHITQIKELVDKKFWAPIILEKHEFDISKLFLNARGSEYTDDSMISQNKSQNVNNKIYLRIKKLIPERKSILVFMDSVENCEIMRNALGSQCEVVSGKTKTKDRERIIEEFKQGIIKVVLCHSALVVGFDFPGLDTVIMGRPTNSLAIFYQIYGRLVRPMEGKQGLFIDFGGNLDRFGDMHNISIENYRGVGHEVFYKDRMVSGTSLKGAEVTKKHLDDLVERKIRLENAIEPNLEHIMTFGKYKDKLISEVPKFYLNWLLTSNLPLDLELRVTIQHILKKPTSLY